MATACSVDGAVVVGGPRAEPSTVPPATEAADTTVPTPEPTAGPADSPAVPVLRLAVAGEPVFDPLLVSVVEPLEMALVDLLSDGLTSWDPQRNTWVPALAADVQELDDGATWRFTLAAASFSDGSPVRADDVVRTFDRILADELSLPATRLDHLEDVVVVDDRTVEFRLAEAFADFPALVSSPVYGIVPPGPVDGTIGSGPFALDDDGHLMGVATELAVELVSVPDEAGAVAAFEAGEVDLAFVSVAYEGPVGASTTSTVEVHFALNTAAESLDDVEQRRTVVNAVRRTLVAEEAFGEGAGAIGRLVPATLACAAPCGGATTAEPPAVGPLSIAYVVEPTGREATLAHAVVAELGAAGIDAVAIGLALEEFVAQVSAGEHDLVRTGWVGLFPSADSQLAPYASTSPDNVAGYTSAAFDELLQAARSSGGASFYDEARSLLEDDAVVLPIARLRIRALVSDRIASIELRHDGSIDLDSLRLTD